MGTLAHVQIAEESLADASEAIPTPPTQPYFLQASVPLLRCNIPRIQASLSSLSPLPHGSHHHKELSVLGAIFLLGPRLLFCC